MGARQNDDVCALIPVADKAAADLVANSVLINPLAPNIGFRHARKILRPNQRDVALAGERLNQIVRIGSPNGAGCCQYGNQAGTRTLCCGLYGRNRSDKPHVGKCSAQVRPDQGKRGIAGNDTQFRRMVCQ